MLKTKVIKDVDQLNVQAFRPPPALVGAIEEAEARGESWWVLMAYGGRPGEARWLVVIPGFNESIFFVEGDQLHGRWDLEHEVFFPEDGPPLNLLGNPVSLSSLEEETEEEDGWRGRESEKGQDQDGYL
jgi:hypothetical protein